MTSIPESTVIPIQGTFDIALGRQMIRSRVAFQGWPATVVPRATVVLTALGELILHTNDGQLIPVTLLITQAGRDAGLRFEFQVPVPTGDQARFHQIVDNLHRAADNVEVDELGDSIQFAAYLDVNN